MSKEDLERRAATFRELLRVMPEDAPEREGYKNTLAGIESELNALEPEAPLPEKVEEKTVPSEPPVITEGDELDVKETPSAQNEELVLPPVREEETASATEEKSEVKEPAKAPEGAVVLANVSTKDLLMEVGKRIKVWMNKK